jgi:hypothetical protein
MVVLGLSIPAEIGVSLLDWACSPGWSISEVRTMLRLRTHEYPESFNVLSEFLFHSQNHIGICPLQQKQLSRVMMAQ